QRDQQRAAAPGRPSLVEVRARTSAVQQQQDEGAERTNAQQIECLTPYPKGGVARARVQESRPGPRGAQDHRRQQRRSTYAAAPTQCELYRERDESDQREAVAPTGRPGEIELVHNPVAPLATALLVFMTQSPDMASTRA